MPMPWRKVLKRPSAREARTRFRRACPIRRRRGGANTPDSRASHRQRRRWSSRKRCNSRAHFGIHCWVGEPRVAGGIQTRTSGHEHQASRSTKTEAVPLPLHQAQAIGRLASHLYGYLPGSGSQQWRGHISFGSIARQQGVGEYWQGGSKLPAIASLLEETLGRRPERFQPLVLSMVREGLRYWEKQGNPLFRSDIDQLNRLIADVGFKFPELSSERFLQSLPEQSTVEPPTEMVGTQSDDATSLDDLKQRLLELSGQLDRPQAGLALESLLADLFALARLAPRGSFQLVGEQRWVMPVGRSGLSCGSQMDEGPHRSERAARLSREGFREVVNHARLIRLD